MRAHGPTCTGSAGWFSPLFSGFSLAANEVTRLEWIVLLLIVSAPLLFYMARMQLLAWRQRRRLGRRRGTLDLTRARRPW